MTLTKHASLLIVAALGCGTSIRTTTINAPPRAMAPRPPETVEVFTSGAPARPHVDVALIEAEEQSSFSVADTPEMIRSMREHGAAMGCDAVVVGGSSSRDPGVRDLESWVVEDPKGRKGFLATCIVYTASPSPPAVAAPSPPAPSAAPANPAPPPVPANPAPAPASVNPASIPAPAPASPPR